MPYNFFISWEKVLKPTGKHTHTHKNEQVKISIGTYITWSALDFNVNFMLKGNLFTANSKHMKNKKKRTNKKAKPLLFRIKVCTQCPSVTMPQNPLKFYLKTSNRKVSRDCFGVGKSYGNEYYGDERCF